MQSPSAALILAAVATTLLLAPAGDLMAASLLPSSQVSLDSPDSLALRVGAVLQEEQLQVDSLSTLSVEGILIVRGSTRQEGARSRVSALLKSWGIDRVANMVRLEMQRSDREIVRDVELALVPETDAEHSRFAVSCSEGVVRVSGLVRSNSRRRSIAEKLARVEGVTSVLTNLEFGKEP